MKSHGENMSPIDQEVFEEYSRKAQSDVTAVAYEDKIREAKRKLGRTTRKVLARLQKEDYINSVSKDLRMSFNGCKYHVEKLQELDLVEKTCEQEGRSYYRATELGEKTIEQVNVPE